MMKQIRMRNLGFLLFTALILTGCSSKNEPAKTIEKEQKQVNQQKEEQPKEELKSKKNEQKPPTTIPEIIKWALTKSSNEAQIVDVFKTLENPGVFESYSKIPQIDTIKGVLENPNAKKYHRLAAIKILKFFRKLSASHLNMIAMRTDVNEEADIDIRIEAASLLNQLIQDNPYGFESTLALYREKGEENKSAQASVLKVINNWSKKHSEAIESIRTKPEAVDYTSLSNGDPFEILNKKLSIERRIKMIASMAASSAFRKKLTQYDAIDFFNYIFQTVTEPEIQKIIIVRMGMLLNLHLFFVHARNADHYERIYRMLLPIMAGLNSDQKSVQLSSVDALSSILFRLSDMNYLSDQKYKAFVHGGLFEYLKTRLEKISKDETATSDLRFLSKMGLFKSSPDISKIKLKDLLPYIQQMNPDKIELTDHIAELLDTLREKKIIKGSLSDEVEEALFQHLISDVDFKKVDSKKIVCELAKHYKAWYTENIKIHQNNIFESSNFAITSIAGLFLSQAYFLCGDEVLPSLREMYSNWSSGYGSLKVQKKREVLELISNLEYNIKHLKNREGIPEVAITSLEDNLKSLKERGGDYPLDSVDVFGKLYSILFQRNLLFNPTLKKLVLFQKQTDEIQKYELVVEKLGAIQNLSERQIKKKNNALAKISKIKLKIKSKELLILSTLELFDGSLMTDLTLTQGLQSTGLSGSLFTSYAYGAGMISVSDKMLKQTKMKIKPSVQIIRHEGDVDVQVGYYPDKYYKLPRSSKEFEIPKATSRASSARASSVFLMRYLRSKYIYKDDTHTIDHAAATQDLVDVVFNARKYVGSLMLASFLPEGLMGAHRGPDGLASYYYYPSIGYIMSALYFLLKDANVDSKIKEKLRQVKEDLQKSLFAMTQFEKVDTQKIQVFRPMPGKVILNPKAWVNPMAAMALLVFIDEFTNHHEIATLSSVGISGLPWSGTISDSVMKIRTELPQLKFNEYLAHAYLKSHKNRSLYARSSDFSYFIKKQIKEGFSEKDAFKFYKKVLKINQNPPKEYSKRQKYFVKNTVEQLKYIESISRDIHKDKYETRLLEIKSKNINSKESATQFITELEYEMGWYEMIGVKFFVRDLKKLNQSPPDTYTKAQKEFLQHLVQGIASNESIQDELDNYEIGDE